MSTSAIASQLRISDLAPHQVQSEIRAMSVLCGAANGINLAQGVCDTDTPHPVVEAALDAIRSGHNIYTRAEGIDVLREAIAKRCASSNQFHVEPHRQVLITSGATGALQATVMALLNAGDECILFEP